MASRVSVAGKDQSLGFADSHVGIGPMGQTLEAAHRRLRCRQGQEGVECTAGAPDDGGGQAAAELDQQGMRPKVPMSKCVSGRTR